MAMYIAKKIIDGRFKYEVILGFRMYKGYKEEVDSILVAEGREDLIK